MKKTQTAREFLLSNVAQSNEQLELLSFPKWLESYDDLKTRKAYRAYVGNFLMSVYQTDTKTETLAARYIKEARAGKRKTGTDQLEFVRLAKEGKASKRGKPVPNGSLKVYLATVSKFLVMCCGIQNSPQVKNELRSRTARGTHKQTIEADLTRDTLRKILLHCDMRMRALVLFLASSGMRVGEALALKMDDLTPEAVPARVTVRGPTAKEENPISMFYSTEAKEALAEWAKVKAKYIAENAYRARNVIGDKSVSPATEDSVFPFSYLSAAASFNKAVEAAGLGGKDATTGRNKLHLHMLRAWWLNSIKTKIPSNVAEAIIGHEGYLSDSYRDDSGAGYTIQEKAEWYLKGESAVTINQDPAQLDRLTGEVDLRTKQFDEVMRANATLTAELTNIKAQIAQWNDYLTEKFGAPTSLNGMAHELLVTKQAQDAAAKQAEEDLKAFNEVMAETPTADPEYAESTAKSQKSRKVA
jgi:integrase